MKNLARRVAAFVGLQAHARSTASTQTSSMPQQIGLDQLRSVGGGASGSIDSPHKGW
jgi:hypothetical protein